MIRFQLLVLLLLGSSLMLSLQAQQKFSAGGRGGLNGSYYTGQNVAPLRMKIGYHAGGYIRYHISEHIALETDILLSSKGTVLDADTIDYRENLLYIDVPLMLRYSPDPKYFNIYFGAQYSRLLSAQASLEGNMQDVSDFYKSSDWGVIGGIGYTLTEDVNVALLISQGISSIVDLEALNARPGSLNIQKVDFFNTNVMLSVTYPFK